MLSVPTEYPVQGFFSVGLGFLHFRLYSRFGISERTQTTRLTHSDHSSSSDPKNMEE